MYSSRMFFFCIIFLMTSMSLNAETSELKRMNKTLETANNGFTKHKLEDLQNKLKCPSNSRLGANNDEAKPPSALLIIDVQRCFMPGGSLPVSEGHSIIPTINHILQLHTFTTVVYSLDSHPANHISFASQHRQTSSPVRLLYDSHGQLCKPSTLKDQNRADDCHKHTFNISQVLWPDHCIEGTEDSLLAPSLKVDRSSEKNLFVFKGGDENIDSYSAFYDNGHFSMTNLHHELTERAIKRVFVLGLATDYCVKFTCLDAKRIGYETYMIADASMGIADESTKEAIEEMRENGVKIINASDLDGLV